MARLLPEKGVRVAGRYRLDQPLGRGGMGSVWQATDERLDRAVALKTLIANLADDDKAQQRFEREAMAVAKLSSPHITQVFDYGVEPWPFIVMELLEGETLTACLVREGRLTPARSGSIVRQVALALATAHEADIVHRDLKPGNVFLAQHHGQELVKVFDFGIAKVRAHSEGGRDLTTKGAVVGTPLFMSPEQFSGSHVDGRADVWALAVLSYLLLTGALPFEGRVASRIIDQIMNRDPPPPSQHVPELSPAIDAFFGRALAKSLDARHPNAQAFAVEFCAIVEREDGSPAIAPEPPTIPLVEDEEEELTTVEGRQRAATLPIDDGGPLAPEPDDDALTVKRSGPPPALPPPPPAPPQPPPTPAVAGHRPAAAAPAAVVSAAAPLVAPERRSPGLIAVFVVCMVLLGAVAGFAWLQYRGRGADPTPTPPSSQVEAAP
jgi:serine/threonine-protein kinase